jgi:hypothetical protein
MLKCHGKANVKRVSNEYKMPKLQFSLHFLLDIQYFNTGATSYVASVFSKSKELANESSAFLHVMNIEGCDWLTSI